jgi:hypothetical protein
MGVSFEEPIKSLFPMRLEKGHYEDEINMTVSLKNLTKFNVSFENQYRRFFPMRKFALQYEGTVYVSHEE